MAENGKEDAETIAKLSQENPILKDMTLRTIPQYKTNH